MTSPAPDLEKKQSAAPRKKFSQERLMIMFTLFFIAGIVLLVVIPEGSPVRGVTMTLYSVAVFWSMFKFCM